MFLILPQLCCCSIHWSQVLSREWRCSWSNTDRRCSNYIWVINNFIAHKGAPYIRGLRVSAVFFLSTFNIFQLVIIEHECCEVRPGRVSKDGDIGELIEAQMDSFEFSQVLQQKIKWKGHWNWYCSTTPALHNIITVVMLNLLNKK